jgi:aminoglycoside phosphotransferase (APT) family kinase protein
MQINAALERRLLAAQFPQWADLAVEPVETGGTDNALFRLGADMAVRLPRVDWAIGQVEKECRWLPKLAPLLPLAISIPLGKGKPAEGYPWSWSVCRWLEGENATLERLADPREAATALAGFIAALQRIDAVDGPLPDEHNSARGVPLAMRDGETRAAIESLRGTLNTRAAMRAWEAALEAAAWAGPPVWIHGDLHSGNLLARQGRLSAVIDFGCLGVGDPACDVMVAWTLLTAESRSAFRAALSVDDATWTRDRGWALSVALIALPYYRGINADIVARAERTIGEVLADQATNA